MADKGNLQQNNSLINTKAEQGEHFLFKERRDLVNSVLDFRSGGW